MIDMARVEVISWDMDGTLYDLPSMKAHVRRMALRAALRAPLTVIREQRALARLRAAMGRVRRSGGDLAGLELADDRAWLAELERKWYLEAIRRTGPRPVVPALLLRLAARPLRQVVLSDYASTEKLEALGLEKVFERCFSGEEIGALKPSARVFEHVIGELGIEPGALLHIGDRKDTDGAAALVGCQVAIVEPGIGGGAGLLRLLLG
jgi:HAD superfamily hydrolase (TIGR01549 family)